MKASKLILFIAIIYFISAKGHLEIIDTEYSVRTAIAFIESHSLLIDPPDKSIVDSLPYKNHLNKIYSKYGIAVWIIFTPVVLAGKMLSVLLSVPDRLIIDYFASLISPSFGVLGLYFYKGILENLTIKQPIIILSTITLALCSFYWKYSTTDFTEIIQACSILGIFYSLSKEKIDKFYGVSLWLSFLIALKVIYIIFVPIFSVYILLITKQKKLRDKVICQFQYLSGILLVTSIILIYNKLRFSNILETGYGNEVNMFAFSYFIRDFFPYMFSYERGLLIYNPVLLLSFIGSFFIPRKNIGFFILVLLTCLAWYCLMCFWEDYYGDYSWGNRFLMPILPLILISISYTPLNFKFIKYIYIILISLSLVLQTVGTLVKIHEIKQVQVHINEITGKNQSHQISTGIILFNKKLRNSNPIYSISDFGIKSDNIIDLSHFNTFYGYNLWLVHLLNHLGLSSYSHFAGIVLLLGIIGLCLSLFRSLLNNSIFIDRCR